MLPMTSSGFVWKFLPTKGSRASALWGLVSWPSIFHPPWGGAPSVVCRAAIATIIAVSTIVAWRGRWHLTAGPLTRPLLSPAHRPIDTVLPVITGASFPAVMVIAIILVRHSSSP